MGVETFVKKLDPKLKKLFINIISIMMILIILTGVLLAVQAYLKTNSYMAVFSPGILVPTVLPFLFLYLGYALLTGKKLNFPKDLDAKKDKKQQFNIPDVYGVRGKLNKPQDKPKTQHKISTGTWTCSKCGFLAKGAKCKKCGNIKR